MNRTALTVSAPALAALILAGCPGESLGPVSAAPAPAASAQPAAGPAPERGPADRRFSLRYTARLDDLPQGGAVRLWIPAPHDDPWQRIGAVTVEAPWPHAEATDPVYGNRILYLEGAAPAGPVEVTVTYEVERWERTTDLAAVGDDGVEQDATVARYLSPARLAAPTDRVRTEAARLAADAEGALARGRAYYDYVLEHMSYDKTGQGWGRGDVAFACEVGKGNCTDFHAYFMSLCAASQIASRFQIGIFGKYEASAEPYPTGGYHCWAEFRVPGKAWVPVDISEADKDASRAEFFFGGHTANRVTLSTGRDLTLEPKQAGAPLNFFVNPYAEVDGQVHPGVSKEVIWTDLPVEPE